MKLNLNGPNKGPNKGQSMILAALLATIAIAGCSTDQSATVNECETLDTELPALAGGSLVVTASGSTIESDDSIIMGSVIAESTVENLPTDIEEQQTLLATLEAIDIGTEDLDAQRDAYVEKLKALIAEAESAQPIYTDAAAALEAVKSLETDPTPEQIAVLETVATDTESFKVQVETITGEMDDIRNDIFNYCLDVEFSE